MTDGEERRLKVLHIATSFATDETSTVTPWLTRLVQAQRRAGMDVHVLTSALHGLGDGHYGDLPVWRFRYSPKRIENLAHEVAIYEKMRRQPLRYAQAPLFLLGGWLKARKLRAQKYDVVHVHWPVPMGLIALPFRGARIVYHYHQTELSLARRFPLLRRLFGPVLRRADIHLCNSSFTRGRLDELYGGMRSEIVPMPLAWDVPPSLPPKEPGRILFVGRMIAWKGGDLLIRAGGLLKQRGLDFKLVFVGEGPERDAWQALAAELDVPAEFPGPKVQAALMEEYARAAVFALPSRFDDRVWVESLGVVLLEAMACGTAVVASRVGGPLDIVFDERNGLFFEPFNFEDLAGKRARLLQDFPLAQQMGRAGLLVAAEHTPEAIAQRLRGIYERLLAG